MEKQKAYESWTISDGFWDNISQYIPKTKRNENKQYKRKEGGGRKPIDERRKLEGILYVLRTGCQWKAAPKEYACGSTLHNFFQFLVENKFFELLWTMGLLEYDELIGIDWEWLSVDGCMTKSPLGGESVGANPTDRGKNGDKKKHNDGRARTSTINCDSGG